MRRPAKPVEGQGACRKDGAANDRCHCCDLGRGGFGRENVLLSRDRCSACRRRPSMDDQLVVRREIEIAAPQSTVFAFLTDPEKLLRWLGTATMEPHPGGLYLVNVGDRHTARGRFTEVIPVHRL